MSQTSQLLRYRPAVIAATSVVAAFGIYVLYIHFASGELTKTALHRSNAVHRPRRDRSRPKVEVSPPDEEAPLGQLLISKGDHILVNRIGSRPLPTVSEVRNSLGSAPDDLREDIEFVALEAILLACLRARSEEALQKLDALGLSALPNAMQRSDKDEIRRLGSELAALLPDVSRETISNAIEQFLEGENFVDGVRDQVNRESNVFAETEDLAGFDECREPSQGLKGLLYYIAEEDTGRKAYEHRGISCEECGENPIRGVRYHCLNCPDFDLCQTCEAQTVHVKTHVFAKIKIPLPVLSQPTREYPVWYPGDPRQIYAPLSAGVKKQFTDKYGFNDVSIESFYDQFTCIANVVGVDGNRHMSSAAIDRRAFNKALTSERWPAGFAMNALYDRIFGFYDTNGDGLIDFAEFVSGLAYLRGPKRFEPLERTLQGYDVDGDEFLERSDFLRLFRAKYDIQRQLITDMVESHEPEQTHMAMDTIRGSQPVSSIFCNEEIPQGEVRPIGGKQMDAFGDMLPLPGTKTILEEDDPWPQIQQTEATIHHLNVADVASSVELQHRISVLEEQLYGPTEDRTGSDGETAVVGTVNGTGTTASIKADDPEKIKTFPHHELLWRIVENGFNEMLDPIFKDKEVEHQEAIKTRVERERWRKEIDEALEDRHHVQEELKSTAFVDPLMATAASSYTGAGMKKRTEEMSESTFTGKIVPTDEASLAKREADIPQQPLEDLLSATGYGTIHSKQGASPSAAAASSSSVGLQQCIEGTPQSAPQSGVQHFDPTLPKHRPDTVEQTTADSVLNGTLDKSITNPDGLKATLTPPSKTRLEHLAALDEADKEVQAQGGPGRLSFHELESMVESDPSRDLRGLVTSWLEWASF